MNDNLTHLRHAHVLAYEQHRLDRSGGLAALLALAQGDAMRHVIALEPALRRRLMSNRFGTQSGDWDCPELRRYLALVQTATQLAQLDLET